jgi:hypothetical protein
MLGTTDKSRRLLLAASTMALLALTACGPSGADATPTLSVDAIFTAAHQTFEADQATQLALTPPTETPSPTLFPTLPPPSPVATISFTSATPLSVGPAACDNSAYVADVTIPDGTKVKAGQSFVKTWALQNTGSCTWSTNYKLAFQTGDQMGGAAVNVPSAVGPGQQSNISVNLVAPTTNGSYKGFWRLQNESGISFGNQIYVQIEVGSGGTAVPTSSTGNVTISGNAVAVDVIITYTGSGSNASGSTKSASGGDYSFTVPQGWSGTVTPSKGVWVFNPVSRPYTNVQSDMSSQDYTPNQPTETPTP